MKIERRIRALSAITITVAVGLGLVTLIPPKKAMHDLTPEVFKGLTGLRTLDLQSESSSIQDLPAGVFDGLTKLRNLELGETAAGGGAEEEAVGQGPAEERPSTTTDAKD